MKALLIIYLALSAYELAGWSLLMTIILMDGIGRIQNKIHDWANQ